VLFQSRLKAAAAEQKLLLLSPLLGTLFVLALPLKQEHAGLLLSDLCRHGAVPNVMMGRASNTEAMAAAALSWATTMMLLLLPPPCPTLA
jgi:hypothetical protein